MLEEIQTKLNKAKNFLIILEHSDEVYLNKIINFYQKMITSWKENVSILSTQDIRDLQEDVDKIIRAVYLPNIPYYQKTGINQKNAFGFFTGDNITMSANNNVLTAQLRPLLP